MNLYEGLRFPEGARWKDGRLWFSDMHTGEIFRADPGQPPEIVVRIDDQPSGLGWAPDGSLLVSSMTRRQVIRVDPAGVQSVFADLSGYTDAPINDMVVDHDGRAFVGGFGYDLYGDAPQRPGPIFVLEPNGDARIARDDLVFPNGLVILPGSRTLVVAETWAARLTAFTITGAGDLVDKRIWAPLPAGATPDGLCVDAESGIWVADISNGRFLRVTSGGTVTDHIDVGDRAPADCALGGRTLYLLTANSWQPSETGIRAGRIEAVKVSVPG
ncbi:SMP-30/gluconolactonase/LRE family protein [Cryptosporangium sp. NPDC048952]|uniref:SMP-30/gluconolactonase/LRE family protein n=1 Tax=Cryptosporangium sp. NPDC048952 TaxID=3363961 RepID=UPI00371C5A81